MTTTRRDWITTAASGVLGATTIPFLASNDARAAVVPQPQLAGTGLKITGMRVTPIALPDPPILAASGCHGPYFLRTIVELETDAGITGIGETRGGASVVRAMERARAMVVGQDAFSHRKITAEIEDLGGTVIAGIELACLDAVGKAIGKTISQLLGGPVRNPVEFSSYLFFRYASDHARVFDDPHLVDKRGRGENALDDWGEVRSAESMGELAWKFHQKFGFRVHKLKAGVLPPDVELEAMFAINQKFGGKHPLRIDPNARWTMETALRIAKRLKELPLDYYEDPVSGQKAMGEVRKATGLTMSTNMCVTRFSHIPEAVETKPIDVVLCDHHSWGGIPACQSLGDMADSLGWSLSQHSNNHAGITMAAMIHVGALIPRLTYASDTHYPWLVEGADIIQGPNLQFREGALAVPTAPGVGVAIDPDKLAKAFETYKKCGMTRRDDATTMRRFEPGWRSTLF